jgi:hypothetical protein
MKIVDTATELFKSMVWDKLVSLAIKRLLIKIPFLAWGPFGWITTQIISYLATELFLVIKEFVDFKTIAFVNKEHQKAFDLASVELKLLAMQKGADSPEFKEAREKAKANLSKFVHFTQ